MLNAQFLEPLAQAIDPVLQPRELGERAAERDRNAVPAVEVDLLLQGSCHVGRAETQPDQIDVIGRDLHQALRIARRQADVDHMREARFARLGGPRRQVQEVRHGRGH